MLTPDPSNHAKMIKPNPFKLPQAATILLFITAIFIFSACSRRQEKTHVSVEDITETVYASGIIKAKDQYQAYANGSGIISQLFVKENDLVKIGSPLLLIRDPVSKLNSTNARLVASFESLNSNRDKISDQENIIREEKAKFENDSLLYIRQQNLWKEGIGTKTALEQKELAYINSKTALASSRLKYNDLLKQLAFNEKQSRNNVSINKSKVEDLTVRSQLDGKVYFIAKEHGEMINPQTPLAVIGSADSFYLELQVDEYDIAKIKEGQQVFVSMDCYKGSVFTAGITKIDPFMNERSKSFTVEAKFIKQPPALYPNLTAEANIYIRTKTHALTIPRNYLADDSFVLVNHDQKQKVVTGLKDYRKAEIISGLSAGEIIYKPR